MRHARAHARQSRACRQVIHYSSAVLILLCASMTITASAQTFSLLGSLDYKYGENPQQASIVQGLDGNFYGAANFGGTFGEGSIFKVTPDGTLSEFYAFCVTQGNCTDGRAPLGLVLAGDGNFYGTTGIGGANDFGSLFKLTPDGTLTTVYSFCPNPGCFQGQAPSGALALGIDGNFYGTTQSGGYPGKGVVFKITPTGAFTTLHVFCKLANCPDGANPVSGLVLARDGNFYGTTAHGGSTQNGTIFRIGPTGNFTTLHNFCTETNCADGDTPNGPLVVTFNGNIFGAAGGGGTGSLDGSPSGLIYELTAGGTYSTIYNFCVVTNCQDGIDPQAITLGADGRLYGVTQSGGFTNNGTIFRLTMGGVLNRLHSFSNADGRIPGSALVEGTDGFYYGTATYGGVLDKKNCQQIGCGTVYRAGPPGSKAFVKTVTPGGHVGDSVIILGNNLIGTTSVTFHGTTASFTVVSATEITATVPTGATTGTVQVATPSGTLNSNVVYRVN